jgi:hypothetical protein
MRKIKLRVIIRTNQNIPEIIVEKSLQGSSLRFQSEEEERKRRPSLTHRESCFDVIKMKLQRKQKYLICYLGSLLVSMLPETYKLSAQDTGRNENTKRNKMKGENFKSHQPRIETEKQV